MFDEQQYIEAILDGDDLRLGELLRFGGGGKSIAERILCRRPTNHSIGFGMTLLQLASIRQRKLGNPSKLLIDHGAEVDLHSACGLGMTGRIKHLLRDSPVGLNDPIDTYFPMQFAVTAGRPEIAQLLIDLGDDVNRDLKKVAYFGMGGRCTRPGLYRVETNAHGIALGVHRGTSASCWGTGE